MNQGIGQESFSDRANHRRYAGKKQALGLLLTRKTQKAGSLKKRKSGFCLLRGLLWALAWLWLGFALALLWLGFGSALARLRV
ncbi:hypothetical protein ACFVVQ_20425 [Paenibacillus chitinolyticus]|uniref:hypothetical protein n=1 Tax=Paenibacillus chitinolyticus TaxID=79263 RepID=UPI0036DB49A0